MLGGIRVVLVSVVDNLVLWCGRRDSTCFRVHVDVGTPQTGDPLACIRIYRDALDAGIHKPTGILSPSMSE